MTKAKISEYDAVAANNTDVNGVNIAENCPPSGMNNMGREIMAALKRFQTGADGDSVTVGGSLVVSNTLTAGPVSATTLNTSGAVVFNDAGADVDFRVEGDTDANLLFVDASTDKVGIGTSSPGAKLHLAGGLGDEGILRVSGSFANAADVLIGGVEFYNVDTSGDGPSVQAEIKAYTADASGGGAYLAFATTTATGEVNPVERLRITSNGYLRMASGSGGIQFGGDTAAANALDDYEEGTWDIVVSYSTSTSGVTYSQRTGYYTKVGNCVFVSGVLQLSNKGTGSGTVRISLPFTSHGNRGGLAVGNTQQIVVNNESREFLVETSASYFIIRYPSGTGATSDVGYSDIATNLYVVFGGSYRV